MGSARRGTDELMESYLLDEDTASDRYHLLDGLAIGDDIAGALWQIRSGELQDGLGELTRLRDQLATGIDDIANLPWPARRRK